MQNTALSTKNDYRLFYSSSLISFDELKNNIPQEAYKKIKNIHIFYIEFIINSNQSLLPVSGFMENINPLLENKESISLDFRQDSNIKDNHCKINLYYKD